MRMNYKKLFMLRRFVFLFCIAVLLYGCFDEIQLDVPDLEGQKIVIEGSAIKGDETLEVLFSVRTPASAASNNEPSTIIPISGAHLIINDLAFPEYQLFNDSTMLLPLTLFEPLVTIDNGSTFQLAVQLPDGRNYESAPEVLFPVTEPEQVDVELIVRPEVNSSGNVVNRNFVEISISTPLINAIGEKAFLRWEMDAIYRFVEAPPPDDNPFEQMLTCYVPRNIGLNNVVVFNGRKSTDNRLTRFPLIEEPVTHQFAHGFLVSVFQQSLSPSAFEYWDQVQRNNTQSGGLFDPVPGEVISNISNVNDSEEKVLGFFYVTQADTIHRLIKTQEAGRPRGFCFGQEFLEDPDDGICQNCLEIRGATLEQPDYWID